MSITIRTVLSVIYNIPSHFVKITATSTATPSAKSDDASLGQADPGLGSSLDLTLQQSPKQGTHMYAQNTQCQLSASNSMYHTTGTCDLPSLLPS